MSRMTVIYQTVKGPASVLTLSHLPIPTPSGRDLLVRVKAVSVNPADCKVRSSPGSLKTPNLILGYDAAGVIEKIGPEVSKFKVGDEVMYAGQLGRPGSNADYQLVNERIVGPKPKKWGYADSAALPLVSLTVWELLVEQFHIPVPKSENEVNESSILIINGAGGVGTLATELASHVLNIRNVVATASRPETVEWCKSHGATHVINHRKSLKPQLEELGIKINYVFICYNTGHYFNETADLIAPLGKIGSIVETDEKLELGKLMSKGASFHWEFMFLKPLNDINVESQGEILAKIAKLVDEGRIGNLVSQKLKFTRGELIKAHEIVEQSKSIGKITLEIGPEGITE